MAVPDLEFKGYFQAIADNFGRSSNLYTLTDTQDKKHFYDMGLMVQTPQPKKSERMPFAEKQEKVERFTVLDGIRKYANDHVLLVGKPGSGKSTALQQLLLEEAKLCLKAEKRKIPVLIELRSWGTSVIDLIQKFFRRHKLRLSTDNIDDLLFEEQLFLLFDGLNELPSDEARREVADFRENNPEIPMIFTTRDLGVGGDLGIKKQLEMQPLTEQQMRSFVTAYLPQQGDEMLRQLSDRLRELGQTPLILKMLCEVFDYAKQVPNNRGELFRQFDKKVENLKEAVPVSEGLRLWKSELLQHLAFVIMQGENPKEKPTDFRLSISRGKAEAVLEDLLKNRVDSPGEKAKNWLQDLLKHYLIQTAADPEQIEFHHQLFQEYYAAEYLRKLLPSLSDGKLKRDYLNLLKWTEPLALMLGLVEDEAQAVRVVQLALDVDLMLGARLAGEVKPEFQEKTVGFILGLDVPQRLKIELLGMTRSEQGRSPLLQAWNNRDYDDIYSVAEALQLVGYDAAMSQLQESEDAAFLARQEEESFFAWDEDLQDYHLCERVLFEIQNIGSSDTAVYNLVKVLDDKTLRSRSRGADVFGKEFLNTVVSTLLQALNHDDFRVRYHAALALGNIGSKAEIDALLKVVKDENYFVRASAVEALGKLGNHTAVSALVQALSDEKYFIRSRAIEALGNFPNKKVVSALIQALKDEKFFIRSKAATALGKILSDEAIEPLIQVLKDEESDVRWSAAIALGDFAEMGNELAVDALIYTLQDEESSVRSSAAYALGHIGNEWVYALASSALQDNHSSFLFIDSIEIENIIKNKFLPQMQKFILTATYQTKDIILNIQEKYQFYNYKIFHTPPVEENKTESQPSNLQNTYNFYGNAGILNTGDVTVEGNQIGEQYNK
ncbi:MAG: NACHT domain-containing protein [Hassallia sp.]